MKFRKKPVVIVAHQIGTDGWPDEIWQGVNENKIVLHLDTVGHPKRVVGHVEIQTLEGVMRGEVGDWIIRGVKGEFYPCKPDIFAATYEPADLAQAPAPVRVKPLVWHPMRDGSGHVWPDKWCADCPVFEKRFFAESTEHRAKVEDKRTARVLAALEAPDAGVVAELVAAAKALKSIVEEIQGAMQHGTWRDEKGQRLKDTPEWVTLYNSLAKLETRA